MTMVDIVVACGLCASAGGALGHFRGYRLARSEAQADVDDARMDAAAAEKAAAQQAAAAEIAMRDDDAAQQLAAELRSDLKDSERKRMEVGACVGQIIEERKVWEDLYVSMMTGCSRAQHWLSLEIERLSKLSGRPISPQVLQVLQETKGLMAQETPYVTPVAAVQSKIDAVTAGKAPRA